MNTLKQINEFLDSQPIAMVGVSRNPKKFGYAAFKELKEKGMKIIPVNPEADEIMGEKSYPNVKSLPADVKGIISLQKKIRQRLSSGKQRKKGLNRSGYSRWLTARKP